MERAGVLLTVVLTTLSVGCVPEPIVYRIRLRPEIESVQKRILSFELAGPAAVSRPHVIFHGVFTPSHLERSEETLEEFEVGYADPDEWKRKGVSLLLQESGKSRLIPLEYPSAPMLDYIYYLRVQVPVSLDAVELRWVTE